MYNEDIKRQFVDFYGNTDGKYEEAMKLFDASEKHEMQMDIDLCGMSQSNIDAVFGDLYENASSSSSVTATMAALRSYVHWCLDNDIKNVSQDALDYKYLCFDIIRRNMVSCPLHLQERMNGVFSKEEYGTQDNALRAYLWMAFMGITDDLSTSVRNCDVDLGRMAVSVGDKQYMMYTESLLAFSSVVNDDRFAIDRIGYASSIKRCDGDLILRGCRNMPTVNSIRQEVSRKVKNAGVSYSLPYKRILASGVYYRAFEQERSGHEVKFKDLYKRKDYARWKLAFHV